ncbi:hypothetical protein, partial [Spongiactinospora sp. TRM90649]|uniref:hypothetical protein n=1 Tax=Spongiactinospora sp. TRM90649 TaxID=3031114 RepID=UPI0023F6243A
FYAFIMHALAFNTLLSSQETDAYTIEQDRFSRSDPLGLEDLFFALFSRATPLTYQSFPISLKPAGVLRKREGIRPLPPP